MRGSPFWMRGLIQVNIFLGNAGAAAEFPYSGLWSLINERARSDRWPG